ncbi:MAG TPA: four helix bundle protein [Gemmatimonadales bacterium]|jgi:four helix bundle protein|nr:four helix bundle protein [Gemmatimonadales bacterium]
MGDYRKLRAWQLARDLVVHSHPLIERLPAAERYALADQWRRAAYGVVLNIAEGATRQGKREFRRYLDTARASLHEIETILDLVVTLGYLAREDVTQVLATRAECARTVYGLLRRMSGPS